MYEVSQSVSESQRILVTFVSKQLEHDETSCIII